MEVRTKTFVIIVLLIAVGGVASWQISNKGLFKGQIKLNPDEQAVEETTAKIPRNAKPDLTAQMQILPPEAVGNDINIDVTIENLGPGALTGETPFKYAVYLNNQEVFLNTDSYTVMEAGDSFNFVYPISRAVYNYENSGTAKVVVDLDDDINEADESNNEKEENYSF